MKKFHLFFITSIIASLLLPLPSLAISVSISSEHPVPTNALVSSSALVKQCTAITPNADGTWPADNSKFLVYYRSLPSAFPTVSGAINFFTGPAEGLYRCSAEIFNQIIQESQELNWFQKAFIVIINVLLGGVDLISEYLIGLFGGMMLSMIKVGSYIGNDVVKEGWPFVQGIANLGFIFVLLYIALATTLRIESVGTSVQRLLPKLLIGALLVNFSLVIGGLLIDASRLVMAAEIRLMSGGTVTPDNLKDKLLERSHFIEGQVSSQMVSSGARGSFWATVLRLLQGSVFRILLAAAFGIIAVNLFVRYIALLILLILSPIPYLAFILPQTKSITDQWWGMFLKWVLYGPIVLFFLIIITKLQNIDVVSGLPKDAPALESTAFIELVRFLIIIALFFVANHVGKKAAGIGSDAVMGFMAKHKRATAVTAATIATGGLGGAAAFALSSRSAQDFYKKAGSNTWAGVKEIPGIKQVSKLVTPAKRDAKGGLLPGQSSLGDSLAGFTDKLNPKIQKDVNNVRGLMDATTGLLTSSPKDQIALMPSKLSQAHVVSALGNTDTEREANIKIIIEDGSQAQRMALAKNKDYIASLSPADLAKLQQTVQNAPGVVAGVPGGVSDRDKTAVIEQMFKTFDDIEKKK